MERDKSQPRMNRRAITTDVMAFVKLSFFHSCCVENCNSSDAFRGEGGQNRKKYVFDVLDNIMGCNTSSFQIPVKRGP